MPLLRSDLRDLPTPEKIGLASLIVTLLALLLAWAAWQWPKSPQHAEQAGYASGPLPSPNDPSPSGSEAQTHQAAPTSTAASSQPRYVRVSLLDFCLQEGATANDLSGEPGCSELRYGTVGDQQFGYVNSETLLSEWRTLVAVSDAKCTEIHLDFGSPTEDGLSTGSTAVRVTFAGRNPITARAANGRIGHLDASKLTPGGPLAIQADTEYLNSTIGINGFLVCEEGSVR